MLGNTPPPSQPESITLKEFFERVPPGERRSVRQLAVKKQGGYGAYWDMSLPKLELHCSTESCNGVRFFESESEPRLKPKQQTSHFVLFACKNCGRSFKTYAFQAVLDEEGMDGSLHKFGENPPFGPPTPARLIALIGPERDYYLKGRRSENQGLGIAAFAYYRRVIESQKTRIIDEIIRVSEKVGASKDLIGELVAAKSETQFSRAVGDIKHGLPQALLIDGHNPLLLLHSALSEGLHAQTDADCLELATSIRVVLTELVERMSTALKEEAELQAAVSRLLAKNGGPRSAPSGG